MLANYPNHPEVALSLEDAIGMLEWAKDIEPSNNLVAISLASLHLEAGQYKPAQKLYQQVSDNSRLDIPHYSQQMKPRPQRNTTKKLRKHGVN
jgi:hypothetical protein